MNPQINLPALRAAVAYCGGTSAVAAKLQCSETLISRWVHEHQATPLWAAIALEILTKRRWTREELCPAPYDPNITLEDTLAMKRRAA
jgi:DNA-binding transcriptional regulator YdaS (Cro superfamily)